MVCILRNIGTRLCDFKAAVAASADAVVFIENENRTRIADDGSRPFHRREKQKKEKLKTAKT